MGRGRLQVCDGNRDGFFSTCDLGLLQEGSFHPGGLFASVGQVGMGFGISPNSRDSKNDSGTKLPYTDLYVKYVSSPEGLRIVGIPPETVAAEEGSVMKKKKNGGCGGLKLKVKVGNPSLRRLISGAIAGAVSRTAVAPLETIRTHLMVGSSGHSTTEVFHDIMKTDGWKGLFRGNFVNVIRVAPSKAIEKLFSGTLLPRQRKPSGGKLHSLDATSSRWKKHPHVVSLFPHGGKLFAYDTVNKHLSPKPGEQPKLPIPASLVAGACAGVSSTLCTYPLELLKTRLTIQRGVYDGLFDAFIKILQEGGPSELYRGLTPSLIGVVPYAATNYFAYDTLRKAYRKIFKKEKIGNIETLLIGSTAGAISSSATFPLEVARKQMQVGAVSGRQVYKNVLHALASILEQEGVQGLYRGLGPSCMKLVPAAGISFMCYEACKRILVEEEDEA